MKYMIKLRYTVHASLVTATELSVSQDFCSTTVFAVHFNSYWYSNDTILSVMSNLDFHAWPELSDISVTMQFCLLLLTKNLLILPPLAHLHPTHTQWSWYLSLPTSTSHVLFQINGLIWLSQSASVSVASIHSLYPTFMAAVSLS